MSLPDLSDSFEMATSIDALKGACDGWYNAFCAQNPQSAEMFIIWRQASTETALAMIASLSREIIVEFLASLDAEYMQLDGKKLLLRYVAGIETEDPPEDEGSVEAVPAAA